MPSLVKTDLVVLERIFKKLIINNVYSHQFAIISPTKSKFPLFDFFFKFPSQKYNALCEVWLQLVDSSGSAEEDESIEKLMTTAEIGM